MKRFFEVSRGKVKITYERSAVKPSPSCIAQQQQTPRSCCWIWTGWQRRTVFDLHPVISQAQTTKSLLLFLLRLNIHQEPHPWSRKKVPLFVPLLSNVLPFFKLPTFVLLKTHITIQSSGLYRNSSFLLLACGFVSSILSKGFTGKGHNMNLSLSVFL